MRTGIGISRGDVHLLEPWTELYRTLGGTPRQNIVLLPTRSCLSQAKIAADRMAPYAASITVIPWDDENIDKWPYAGNHMWKHFITELEKMELADKKKGLPPQPKYFMELDCTPIKVGWGDMLESEYAVSGCRCMGAVVPSRRIVDGQVVIATDDPSNPPHMVGTGIYPPDTNTFTDKTWLTVPSRSFGRQSNAEDSWDIMLRFYFRRSLHATKLIDHKWSTINYVEEDLPVSGGRVIRCQNDPKNPFGTDHSGVVDEMACVVHGCKDGSLAKIIMRRMGASASIPAPAPAPALLPAPAVTLKPETPTPAAPASSAVHFDKSLFKELQRKEGENAPQVQAPQVQSAAPSPTPQSKPQPESLADQESRIMEIIGEGKPLRLNMLSKRAKVPEDVIRKMAEFGECPFTVSAGPSKWVRARELQTA